MVAATALVAVVFAFVAWRFIRDRIKRIPPVTAPSLALPDLGALAPTRDDGLPEHDTGADAVTDEPTSRASGRAR